MKASLAGEYLFLINFQFVKISKIMLVDIFCPVWWLLLNVSQEKVAMLHKTTSRFWPHLGKMNFVLVIIAWKAITVFLRRVMVEHGRDLGRYLCTIFKMTCIIKHPTSKVMNVIINQWYLQKWSEFHSWIQHIFAMW